MYHRESGSRMNFNLSGLDVLWTESTCSETEICEFHMASRVNEEVLLPINSSLDFPTFLSIPPV
jgi:hypothetical protein